MGLQPVGQHARLSNVWSLGQFLSSSDLKGPKQTASKSSMHHGASSAAWPTLKSRYASCCTAVTKDAAWAEKISVCPDIARLTAESPPTTTWRTAYGVAVLSWTRLW